ncbi:hypothetical protein AMJ86_05440 [bacterium SM23_57]|nr:MAG: hypothetical protein AMJ86_05440 [bacterium SM23_57]
MKRATVFALLLGCLAQWSIADILYTKSGETYTGSVESITRQEVLFRISRGGFEYEIRSFLPNDILEILDEEGQPIPFLFPPKATMEEIPSATDNTAPREEVYYRFSLTKTYSRWPLLIGTVAFATIGIVKLSSAASDFDEIYRDEELGYEVTARKDEASRERVWGELSVAAGVVCLVLAITPEKIRKPLLSSVHIRDDWSGITWSLPLQ